MPMDMEMAWDKARNRTWLLYGTNYFPLCYSWNRERCAYVGLVAVLSSFFCPPTFQFLFYTFTCASSKVSSCLLDSGRFPSTCTIDTQRILS